MYRMQYAGKEHARLIPHGILGAEEGGLQAIELTPRSYMYFEVLEYAAKTIKVFAYGKYTHVECCESTRVRTRGTVYTLHEMYVCLLRCTAN